MRYEKVKMKDLKNGDQIAVLGNVADLSRWLRPLMAFTGETCYHHGIYDADNKEVFHFTGDSKADTKPQKSDFTEFFAGHYAQLYRFCPKLGTGTSSICSDKQIGKNCDGISLVHVG